MDRVASGGPFGAAMDSANVNQSYLNYQLARGDRALAEYEKARQAGLTPEGVSAVLPGGTSRMPAGAYGTGYGTDPVIQNRVQALAEHASVTDDDPDALRKHAIIDVKHGQPAQGLFGMLGSQARLNFQQYAQIAKMMEDGATKEAASGNSTTDREVRQKVAERILATFPNNAEVEQHMARWVSDGADTPLPGVAARNALLKGRTAAYTATAAERQARAVELAHKGGLEDAQAAWFGVRAAAAKLKPGATQTDIRFFMRQYDHFQQVLAAAKAKPAYTQEQKDARDEYEQTINEEIKRYQTLLDQANAPAPGKGSSQPAGRPDLPKGTPVHRGDQVIGISNGDGTMGPPPAAAQ